LRDFIYINNESDFCNYITKHCHEICQNEFVDNSILHKCGAGLWCASYPIKDDVENYGFISIGHKRIEGENEEETIAELRKNLDQGKIQKEDYDKLIIYLNAVGKVNGKSLEDFMTYYVPIISGHLISEIQNQKRIRELKTLSTYLAHSFLTPIQAIVAHSENLLVDINEIDREYLNIELIEESQGILEEVTKLAYSAENLRDWMQEEKDFLKLDLSKKIPIYCVIRDAVDLFRREAFSHFLRIRGPIPGQIPFPYIRASEPHLRKVFYNLMNNAVKYSFEGNPSKLGEIEIYCYPIYMQNGDFYCIEIRNNGVGILPEEIEKVFEHGYRGKFARDRNRFGSGLGLATVRDIIVNHGGSIEITSDLLNASDDSSKLNLYRTSVQVILPLNR
jgi:signal transduction histidine kinase